MDYCIGLSCVATPDILEICSSRVLKTFPHKIPFCNIHTIVFYDAVGDLSVPLSLFRNHKDIPNNDLLKVAVLQQAFLFVSQ